MHTRPYPMSARVLWTAIVAIGCLLSFTTTVSAQSARIQHKVTKENLKVGPALGRDLWFTMAENYQWSSSGKYYDLYVTSPNSTTVNIQVAGAGKISRPIEAEKVLTFRIPLAWELRESGTIEKKAIRVWSDDADLSAYVLSRNPATSDGMYIIPSIGWGTEYVVAAYHSHWAGAAGGDGDLPSEFAIVANQDNTEVTINPTTDIRKGQDADAKLYPKNVPFTIVLMRGEAVQYQAMRNDAQAEGFDFTGTTIKSSKPVGVVGGNMCANVPVEFPWCDHICDMIPPVRTWAKTYYTAPFAQRKGGDTYLVIASEDNQYIYRVSQSGRRQHAQLNKYEYYFRHDIEDASRWESDKPFLLAQYCNSTSWPGYPTTITNNGIGDPAYTIVNSVEQYTKKVVFQTPTIATGGSAFQNFVNVIVHKDAVTTSKYDGKSLAGAGGNALPVDNEWMVYRFNSVSPGTHIVESDSGAGVYIYGYGNYDSYAWTGGYGNKTYKTEDTIAPVVETPGNCFDATITATDIHEKASKLSSVVLDSSYNMNFDPDLDFVPGSGADQTFYKIAVQDNTREAYIRVKIYDNAGNMTQVVSTYVPQIATITPPITNFGKGQINGTEIVQEVTIKNEGRTDFTFTELRLKLGNVGFRIVSADLSPLKPGEERKIQVGFIARQSQTVTDTILFGDACVLSKAVVVGNGGAPDFVVNDVTIGPIPAGTMETSDGPANRVAPPTGVQIQNPSDLEVTITDIKLDANPLFRFDPAHPMNTLPIVVGPGGAHEVVFEYRPVQASNNDETTARYTAKLPDGTVIEKTSRVKGIAWEPGAKIVKDDTTLTMCPTAASQEFFQFTITITGTPGSLTRINAVDRVGDVQYFSPLVLEDAGRNPLTLPKDFIPGEIIYVRTTFTPPANTTGKYEMKVVVKDTAGQPLSNGTVTATAFTEYREYALNTPLVTYPTTAYGSTSIRRPIVITNTADLDISVNDVRLAQNPGSHPTSFRVIAPAGGWPLIIPAKQSANLEIEFDPTVDPAAVQRANFAVATNSCRDLNFSVEAPVSVGGFSAQAMTPPEVFSCVLGTHNVEVRGAGSPSGTLTWTITGPNAVNFASTLTPPLALANLDQITIPVTFMPDASPGFATYQASMNFEYTNAQNEKSQQTIQLAGTAGGITAAFTSAFANPSATVGSEIDLPIMANFTKALPTLTVADAKISKLRFVYEYNTDLLSIFEDNIANAVRNLPNGWSVVDAESSVGGGTLTLTLAGDAANPLPEIDKIADIHFFVRLPNKNDNNDLKMVSVQVFDAAGNDYASCIGSAVQGGTFTLIYQCGDKTLQDLMSGSGRFADIAPPVPNPAQTGSIVSFKYGTRVESPVSIVIYDILGNEVDRVIDNINHPAGNYEVKYSTKNLGTGTYTYQFVTNMTKSSDRLVIQK